MAGEFLAIGKLFKRGYQASITFRNAKGIDVMVHNPTTDKSFVVQIKTLREKNCFEIKKEDIKSSHIYVFILLHDVACVEDFFIVPGRVIVDDINRFFGSCYRDPDRPPKRPAINYGPLAPYKDNWQVFDA
jgi:hypothetical protein